VDSLHHHENLSRDSGRGISSLDSAGARVWSTEEAVQVTGGLSRTSKMPGRSYSLPASACITGSKLAKIPGTVCYNCYARKKRYLFPQTQRALARRLEAIRHPDWVEAMCFLIRKSKTTHFRWHDSGDLQGRWHLERIAEIARRMPDVKFWLPTKELGMVSGFIPPPNLVIRVSGACIDAPAPGRFKCTSTVVTEGATCQASKRGGKCGNCRKCWSPKVANVSYALH